MKTKLTSKEFLRGWDLTSLGNNRYMALARPNNQAKERIAFYKEVGNKLVREVENGN